jgi:hypothetical protein
VTSRSLPPRKPAIRSRNRGRGRSQLLKWGSLAVAACGGIAALAFVVSAVLDLLQPDEANEIAAAFEPAAFNEAGVPQSSSPELQIAEQFAEFARQRDSGAAIKLIDVNLFQERLLGPEGSYEAITKEIKAGEVLSHFATYPLESTGPYGGKRLWQVLGTTQFRNAPAAIMRYYSEPTAPLSLFDDKQQFEPLATLLTFEEFETAAAGVFAKQELGTTKRGRVYGGRPDALDLLPPRVGYALLVFDSVNGKLTPCDLVNVMGLVPLSSIGGNTYLVDWTVIRVSSSGADTHGLKPMSWSIYGESPQDLGGLPDWGVALSSDASMSWSPDTAAELFQHEEIRAVQVCRVAVQSVFEQEKLADSVARFRERFPDDPGADLAVVITAMMVDVPRINTVTAPVVADSAARLYELWRDPFLLYVQGVAAEAAGDSAAATEHFLAARRQGFECVGQFNFFIQQAIAAGNKEAAIAELSGLSRYWDPGDRERDEQAQTRLAGRWERYLKQKEQEAAMAEDSGDNSRGNFGANRFGPGGLRGPPGGRFGGGIRPGMGEEPPGRPGGRQFPPRGNSGGRAPGRSQPPGRGTPPAMSGPTVTLHLTSAERFDARELTTRLLDRLGVKNHRMQSSGREATITIGYDGSIASVIDQIDFGSVTMVDEQARRVEVTVE